MWIASHAAIVLEYISLHEYDIQHVNQMGREREKEREREREREREKEREREREGEAWQMFFFHN